jgi:hypothetical protein
MKRIAGLVLALLMAGAAFGDAKGDEIAKKYYGRKKADDTTGLATMTLIDKAGTKKVRKLEMFTKEGAEGKNSFVNFLEPADVAGTKFLTLTHRGSDSEQRLYLPALKKDRKISSSSKDGEFVNSDFFYYDMEDRFIEDNTNTFLSDEETIADKAFTGMKFSKIELKAKADNCPYAKTIAYVNMADNFIYKMECYDKKDNSLLKTVLFVKVDTIKGVLIPVQTLVTNHRKGTRTLLQMNDMKVNVGLKDEVFSVKNLGQ